MPTEPSNNLEITTKIMGQCMTDYYLPLRVFSYDLLPSLCVERVFSYDLISIFIPMEITLQ